MSTLPPPHLDPVISPLRAMHQPKDSELAIISLVSGLLGWFLLPFLGALCAVITGHLAKREIRESMGLITGKGMATAGLILGYLQLGFMVLVLAAIILLLIFSPQVSEVFKDFSLQL